MHGVRAVVTRYLPRSSRAGDASNRRSVSGRTRGPINGRMPTIAGRPTITTANRIAAVMSRAFFIGSLDGGAFLDGFARGFYRTWRHLPSPQRHSPESPGGAPVGCVI